MSGIPMSQRRGFTLVELLVGLLVASVVGAALMRLVLSQSRFYGKQDAIREARTTSRGALNVMLSELRMVDPVGGLVAVAPESITVRVPYAFGLVCAATAGATVVSLLPADSAVMSHAVPSGYGVRDDTTGQYTYREGSVSVVSTAATPCTAVSITTLGGGRVVSITPGANGAKVGSAVMLYQRIRYAYAPSATIPGQSALWRRVIATGAAEELVAPFQATARFRFHVLNNDTAQSIVPANLATIRGFELVLNGASSTLSGGSRERFNLTTAVFFKNRVD